jgi:hypothetical protein
VCERIRRDPRKNVRELRKLIDVCSHFVLVYHPKNILSVRRKPRQQERAQVQDAKETLPNGGLLFFLKDADIVDKLAERERLLTEDTKQSDVATLDRAPCCTDQVG